MRADLRERAVLELAGADVLQATVNRRARRSIRRAVVGLHRADACDAECQT